jgi:ABC-type Fe3+/spermidine/putrescine transport system ATPase subunit
MIRVKNVNASLGSFKLKDISLHVQEGEFFAILGPTGAGKSVVLEAIAGLNPITAGSIHLNGREITRIKPEGRGISICYQDYCLFPHMTVKENISYGLRFKKERNAKREKELFDMLMDLLKIEGILSRYPINLSGGEKQRVSLARALIVEPAVLLLDEPLSALDPHIKEIIQEELKRIHKELKITSIMVTHDFQEAHRLADRMAIMRQGVILQQGSLEEIFHRPKTKFVAEFVGTKNLFEASALDQEVFAIPPSSHFGIRPEKIQIGNQPVDAFYKLQGTVTSMVDTGIYLEIRLQVQDRSYMAYLTGGQLAQLNLKLNEKAYFGFNQEDINIFSV